VLNNPTKYTDPSGYAYNGFTASNNDIGASSTSSISDATEAMLNACQDFKSGIARDASDDYSDPRGGTELSENDGDPIRVKLTDAERKTLP